MQNDNEIISAKEALERSNEAFIKTKLDLIKQVNNAIYARADAGKTIAPVTFSPNYSPDLVDNVIELIKAAGYNVTHIEVPSIPYKYDIEWGED